MRTEFLCISVLRVASGPRMKLTGCKSALTSPPPQPPPPPPPPVHPHPSPVIYSTDRSKAVSRCYSCSLLLCGLFYEAICFMFYLVLFCSCVFSVLLALRLPRLGKRELILSAFRTLFDLRLFGFVCFLFLLVSGMDCGLRLWHSLDFTLTFFYTYVHLY